MPPTPTIVAASLDSAALEKSISELVNKVKASTEFMAKDFDEKVSRMEQSVRSLGNSKNGNGIENASSRRTRALKEEEEQTRRTTQAIKEKDITLDQSAQAMQKAISNSVKMTTQEETRLKEEAKIRAEYVSELSKLAKESHAGGFAFDMAPYMSTSEPKFIYAINDARAKGLTIEQQIENILRSQNDAEGKLVNTTNEEVEAQKRISQEIAKRTYKTPTTYVDDSFNKMTARAAGVLPSELQATSTKIVGMTNYLKNLQSAYINLTSTERNTPFGKKLKIEIQTLSRDIQTLRKDMSRPVSFDFVKNIQVKTIDDMIYKMQQLQSYKNGIDLTKPGAENEIKKVDDAMKNLQKDMDKYMSKGKQMGEINNALGRSWNYMKNRLAFYFTVGASTQFIKNLIEVRSQYEMNERALGVLINSAERGSQIFNELSQMALVSPYTLIELSSAAKQLTAYDVAARDVVDTTRRLADMASAVGVPMERLTYALGQIKAYGYLNSRDARMFANSGIPLVKQLSEYYTELEGKMVSVGDVYDRMKKKAIDYNDVMAVVTKMTDQGGKFFNFQAKMADTLKVRLANLNLAWNNMLNDMGKQTQGVLTTGINMLKELFLRWKDIDTAMTRIIQTFGFLKSAHLGYYLAVRGSEKAIALETVVGTKLANVLRTVYSSFKTLITSPWTWAVIGVAAVGSLISALIEGNTAMKEFNKSLREAGKDNYENISKFIENYTELRDSLYKTVDAAKEIKNARLEVDYENAEPRDIDKEEAVKAWEAMREQIELVTKSSDQYIGRLLSIENVSERLRQGFKILDEVKTVSAALKEIGDDGIVVTREWNAWWNLWLARDGLIKNLKDYNQTLKGIINTWGSVKEASNDASEAAAQDMAKLSSDAAKLERDIAKFTDSIMKFINNQGFGNDAGKINESFKQITDKLINENQLDPETAYQLQLKVEDARAKAVKTALINQKADLIAAWRSAEDEKTKVSYNEQIKRINGELATFEQFNGESRVEWERFTKWIKEQHLYETREMFKKTYDAQKQSLNMQGEDYTKWVKNMSELYANSHNLAIDDVEKHLKKFVWNANQMRIFIPVILGDADNKSIYQQLTEADNAIDTAYQKIQRLNQRKAELMAMGGMQSSDEKVKTELMRVTSEIASAQRDYNTALEEGGHSKKEDAEGRKAQTKAAHAQKEAESELQRTLKEEIQLIDKVRSAYNGLMKEGAGRENAIESSTRGFEESVSNINRVLSKFGIEHLDLKKFAGINNPREIVTMLQSQLDKLMRSGSAKPAEIQDLQVEINKLKIDAEKYDLTMITKGLNNELDRLKEDYELGIELEANPELAGMFVEMFDIDLDSIPKTAEEYSERYTRYLNKYLKEKGSKLNIASLMKLSRDDISEFKRQMEEGVMNEEWFNKISDGYKAVREARDKEMREAVKSWDKLLEKYAEYEYKQKSIAKNADNERKSLVMRFGNDEQKSLAMQIMTKLDTEDNPQRVQELRQDLKNLVNTVAEGDDTRIAIEVAINEKELQESARVAFEQFQKSPDWITATGDVSDMSNKAIKMLIKSIEAYKRQAKYLDPKQMKQMNNALHKLYKEVKKDNPFNVLKIAAMEAKERASVYDDEITRVEKRIKELKDKEGSLTVEQMTQLDALKIKLQELIKKRDEASKLNPSDFVAGINTMVNAAKSATQIFTDMVDAIGDTRASRDIKRVFSVLEKGGQGAVMGAQIGGGYGALIGAVAGVASGIVQTFADQWSGNASITKAIERSQRSVKSLENAYKDLDEAVNKAYGTAVIGAKKAAIANKQLQLEELKRQMILEQSRKAKNRDEDKILELSGQIRDLEYDIRNSTTDIVNDLMGISSVGDFAENLVAEMISAFKNGEDYMEVFEQKFEDMIDNMIMKAIVSKVVTQYIDALWDRLDERINTRSDFEAQEYARAQERVRRLETMSDTQLLDEMEEKRANPIQKMYVESYKNQGKWDKMVADYMEAARMEEKAAKERLDAASAITDSDVDALMGEVTAIMPELGQKLKDILGQYYKFGESSEHQLSQLQQGIQGITEDTGGALEAYMNGVSQQVYLQSDLLTQIRDAVITINMDLQLATISQMLFQLQQSYQVQKSIEMILTGALVPSGRAFCVEIAN